MLLSRFSLRGLQTLFLLLAVIHATTAQKKSYVHHQQHHEPAPPPPPPCTFPTDYSTTEAALRTSIFKGDVETAAKILTSNMTLSLSRGMMYDDAQECLLVESEDRSRDPDIVAMQAIALNAEKTGDTYKLAHVIGISYHRECECPIYSPEELDEAICATQALLDDPAERKRILDYTGEEEHHDQHYDVAHDQHHDAGHVQHYDANHDPHGRRLMQRRRSRSTRHNSFWCANCDPRDSCARCRAPDCPRNVRGRG